MTVSAWSGPLVVYGNPPNQGTNSGVQYNPDNGPSFGFGVMGQLDNSVGYQPGQGPFVDILGWVGQSIQTLAYNPATKATGAIVAAAATTSGTPMTLVSAAGNGVAINQSVTSRGNGQVITGLLALDGPTGLLAYGTNAAINAYDIRTCCGRAVSVTANAGATGGAIVIRGYDYLGFPMQESITSAAASTVSGKKAFKYIFSVTPSFTDAGHTYSVDTTDIFGFPMRADAWESLEVYWAGASITSSATGTFTFADITNPATATTGDVRGTWLTSSASNGTNVLSIYQSTPPQLVPGGNTIIGSITTNGTTAVGNKTLNFASVPAFVAVGMTVFDKTQPNALPSGTLITAVGASTLTISNGANLQVGGTDVIVIGSPNPTAGLIGLPQFFTTQTVGGVVFG